ncbi:neuraminidase-like domain-containing protein [Pseudomonas sp. SAICEU22]|uniref:Neuraminidase-like domain-containing protein n=1 Tax=Pseudomonas agronomica TaxID=2979328 RepID=A0ABT3F4B8_9PSED|nr:neuraminidase-like domain-containing protein [Pseudomonas agronomica]MCW1243936.1 neuraminidase-like domain-containing protein [Pseudomonas agronomica]
MELLQINELTERYTAAMLEAVLGQGLWEGAVTLRNPDDLNEYLMLDTQDRAQLEATWISANVRCLQQHIQSVYSGMELGYESSHFEPEDTQYWYQMLSHYSTWSANVTLKDQAENYIVPSLRLKKTGLFRTLENGLNQMRLSTDSVHRALMEYTQAFQRICDLDVIGGYVDGADIQKARYCLVGQERTPPFAYLWRSVRVDVNDSSERINPAAWGEWQPIDIATVNKVLDIRPVYWGGRLVMVWCEWHERQVDDNGVVQIPWSLEIKLSSSSLNGQWSAPISLHQRFCEYDVSNGRLTAVSLGDGDPRDDLLAVCYTNRQSLDGHATFQEIEIHETRDALFRKVPDHTATVLELTFARFNKADRLQQKVGPDDFPQYTIDSSELIGGSINEHFFLDVVYTRESDGGNDYEVLRVRGRCNAVQEVSRSIERLSISWPSESGNAGLSIVAAGARQLRITMTLHQEPTRSHTLELRTFLSEENGSENPKITIHAFVQSDFKETVPGEDVWIAEKVVPLSDSALNILLGRTADEVRAGAGFFMTGLGEAVLNEQNQVVPKVLYSSATFLLKLGARTVADPRDWVSTGLLDGEYATPWLTYRRQTPAVGTQNFPIDTPIVFEFGELGSTPPFGRNTFSVILNQRARRYPKVTIDKSDPAGAQFLHFDKTGQALKYVRVNSTFGPALTSRAAVSVDALLAWETQHIEEPARPDGTQEENGPFDGCNGLYFWEMFFHTPDLVGARLTAEGRYREAQGWYEYIFNPLAREINETAPLGTIDSEMTPAPAYWRCRPLGNDVDPSYEIDAPTDPDAIGYSAPVHMRIALFLRYVDNLIAWGDSQYRRLDYDSMIAARLNYTRALSLMGREPEARTATTWQPVTLGELLGTVQAREALKAFEADFSIRLADVPTGMTNTPRFELLGTGVFLPGINERPERLRRLLKERLDNLRQNRSIDGQPLSIPLFSPPLDPLDLLRSKGNSELGEARNPGGQVQVVPYKWRTVHNLALQGTEFLIQQEDLLRSWLEQRDRTELEELQQSHMIELVDYARSVHESTIAQLEATAASLRQSDSMLKARIEHYQALMNEGVSQAEYEVLQISRQARDVSASSGALRAVSAGLDSVPNIFGVANGGVHFGAAPQAAAEILQIAADFMLREAEETSVNEQYRRRAQEWAFMFDQSNAEARVLREQILAQEHAISAARASLLQTEAANTQAMAVYAFYKNRATGRELSNWVVGQVKTLIYQVYDVVVGLCLCAETCWQYEMGDFKSRFIRPDVWMDTYHGLTTGYSLKLDLLRMAAARIKRDEHRLELVKTISLRSLAEVDWADVIDTGKMRFSLNEKLFDEDYPGHYCRQVKRLALTFPGVLGPYENVRAVLVQLSSATTLEPDIGAVRYLHNPESPAPDTGTLVQNLRPYQQTAFSVGLDDSGITGFPDDERYQCFEGTGAHADYELTFPRVQEPAQKRLLESLTDVILTLTYQAKDGGPTFATEVEDELTALLGANMKPEKAPLTTR